MEEWLKIIDRSDRQPTPSGQIKNAPGLNAKDDVKHRGTTLLRRFLAKAAL